MQLLFRDIYLSHECLNYSKDEEEPTCDIVIEGVPVKVANMIMERVRDYMYGQKWQNAEEDNTDQITGSLGIDVKEGD